MFKKKLRTVISLIIICLLTLYTKWVGVMVPKDGNPLEEQDYQLPTWRWTQINWNYSVLKTISFIHGYLRFAIGFVCFLFMVINWFKLITARWDSKETSAATSALIKSLIWIAICFLAYIIVNIAIKLFI